MVGGSDSDTCFAQFDFIVVNWETYTTQGFDSQYHILRQIWKNTKNNVNDNQISYLHVDFDVSYLL